MREFADRFWREMMRSLILAILLLSLPSTAGAQSTSSQKPTLGPVEAAILEQALQGSHLSGTDFGLDLPLPTEPFVPSIDGWVASLSEQAANKMDAKLPGANPNTTLSASDQAALRALQAMFAHASGSAAKSDVAQMTSIFQQAGLSAVEAAAAAAVLSAPAQSGDAGKNARETALQKLAIQASAKAGLEGEQAPAPVLIQALKAAVEQMAQAQMAPPLPVQASALLGGSAQQKAEIARNQQERKIELTQLAAQKAASSSAEKGQRPLSPPPPPPPPPPGPVWPAWIGANNQYASINANAAPNSFSGFRAFYIGEARGSDGEGNDYEGYFDVFFDARPGGDVFLEGVLLGLDFDGVVTDPVDSGFMVEVREGWVTSTTGTSRMFSNGILDGKFYGSDNSSVGGTFELEGRFMVPDMNGHFAGTAQ